MAVPKRRKSKARRDMRKAHHLKPPRLNLVPCPRCKEPKLPHTVCSHCGTYKDREVIAKEV